MLKRPGLIDKAQGTEFRRQADDFSEGRTENRRVITVARDERRLPDALHHVPGRGQEFNAKRVREELQVFLNPLPQGEVLAPLITAKDPGVLDNAPRCFDDQRIGEGRIHDATHLVQRLQRARVTAKNELPKGLRHGHPERRTLDQR